MMLSVHNGSVDCIYLSQPPLRQTSPTVHRSRFSRLQNETHLEVVQFIEAFRKTISLTKTDGIGLAPPYCLGEPNDCVLPVCLLTFQNAQKNSHTTRNIDCSGSCRRFYMELCHPYTPPRVCSCGIDDEHRASWRPLVRTKVFRRGKARSDCHFSISRRPYVLPGSSYRFTQ